MSGDSLQSLDKGEVPGERKRSSCLRQSSSGRRSIRSLMRSGPVGLAAARGSSTTGRIPRREPLPSTTMTEELLAHAHLRADKSAPREHKVGTTGGLSGRIGPEDDALSEQGDVIHSLVHALWVAISIPVDGLWKRAAAPPPGIA